MGYKINKPPETGVCEPERTCSEPSGFLATLPEILDQVSRVHKWRV
jgi:hypothetical protein